ncbi:tyrosine-protein phosphatase [Arthrobacter sp. M4]|uniref:tyrosine-protein phosphatase n=1 Tax=Arthrobacter sp. M4 TaxID=218160 RepID=UPI001CDBB53F|nr:tyrosine-protein phosphatase [Arthrobacter sp. M4]MCA4135273.1 tyrosine-protein phosphatase [Arthrobacter sp. M4]
MTTLTEDSLLGDANRPLAVGGTYNFRSTGGYTAAGRVIREGKLFRSDGLHRLTDDGRAQIAALGIRLVIDLRDSSEIDRSPSQLDGLALESRHNPIFQAGSVPGLDATTTLMDIYRLMIARHADRLAGAVRLIADSGTDPVLVHCTAGKDRTGVVIALALIAAGVDRGQVLRDYAATEQNLAGEWVDAMLAAVAQHPGVENVGPDLRDIIAASPAAVLAATLEFIDRSYGSVRGLLQTHGFNDDDLDRLTAVLTTPSPTTA